MKLHIVTVGQPKLLYAKQGWDEYLTRLKRFYTVRTTHVTDKRAYDTAFLMKTAGNAFRVALVIEGIQYSSPRLAQFLAQCALTNKELCFFIGGPEGLPQEVVRKADSTWSLSRLTLPHDLAMVVTLEALYRASTIQAGKPYHK